MAVKRKASSTSTSNKKHATAASTPSITSLALQELGALGQTHASIVHSAALAHVDVAANTDKYYTLQLIKIDASSDHYVFSHWGRTGTVGQHQLRGPMPLSEAEADFSAKFLEKTGNSFGSPFVHMIDRYDLLQTTSSASAGTWEYYVNDGIDGKATGWYPYVADAIERMELLWQTFEANEGYTQRIVQSGTFSYLIDLVNLTQTNVQTQKKRTIRRVAAPTTAVVSASVVAPTTASSAKTKRQTKKSPKKAPKTKSPSEFSIVSVDGVALDVNLARIAIEDSVDDFVDLTLVQAIAGTFVWTITGSCGKRTSEIFEGPYSRTEGEARFKKSFANLTGNAWEASFVAKAAKYVVLTPPTTWDVYEDIDGVRQVTGIVVPFGSLEEREIATELWAWFHANPQFPKRLMNLNGCTYVLDFIAMTVAYVRLPNFPQLIRKLGRLV
ncbi:hypothetical protein ACHHYP_11727 [Achlya hypogyna]|uniref:NAD(+) ADP-ribosyltransferase n=1 Tax=Achlya hypogyna TaxID=1202772 RepID=A0A1V9YIP2_ACHHY|nr:hypothetical protein ACHHYP_11727 [Achlya hypogyna]